MRKICIRVLSVLLLVTFLMPTFACIAFASEDDHVEFPSSSDDYKGYSGTDEIASTWELLRKAYGSEESVGSGTAAKRKGFFWSHGVTVSAGMNYPLFAGLWGCHPAIYITVLPEAQLARVPTKSNSFSANDMYNRIVTMTGWNAYDNMSMNYWLALAQFFRYGSESYNFYKKANNGEIKAYITLKKASAGSSSYKEVTKVVLLIASNQQHTNGMTGTVKGNLSGRFFRTTGLYEDPLEGKNVVDEYPFYNDHEETDTAAKPASNSVLFYDLENGAKYQVIIDVRITYTDSSGASYGQSVFRDESIVKAFSGTEKDGLVSVSLSGYAVGGNGSGNLMLKNLGVKSRDVSLMEASRYIDSGLDISSDNPMTIMTDINLFQTTPNAADAEKLSSVFKLLRRLSITAVIFGLGWAIFKVVLIDASGFMLMRLKMELHGWLGLIVLISACLGILGVLVKILYGI